VHSISYLLSSTAMIALPIAAILSLASILLSINTETKLNTRYKTSGLSATCMFVSNVACNGVEFFITSGIGYLVCPSMLSSLGNVALYSSTANWATVKCWLIGVGVGLGLSLLKNIIFITNLATSPPLPRRARRSDTLNGANNRFSHTYYYPNNDKNEHGENNHISYVNIKYVG
jgi:hypothetical protein